MTEKQIGDVLLKGEYVNGELALIVSYDKAQYVDMEFKIKAQAKELLVAILQPLVESTETQFDNMALEAILKQL
jgi:hypothetical protein